MPTQKVIETGMNVKMRDQSQHREEIIKRREKMRRWLQRKVHYKEHHYRKAIDDFRSRASKRIL